MSELNKDELVILPLVVVKQVVEYLDTRPHNEVRALIDNVVNSSNDQPDYELGDSMKMSKEEITE